MTFERALNADLEPQNWLLHHKNYQGHRFSALRQINADTVGGLRLAFTVGLGGLQAGGRYANGDLEATPLVDDGMMSIPDGWGSVYAIDVSSGKKGEIDADLCRGHVRDPHQTDWLPMPGRDGRQELGARRL
jgi:alcohol dehydrogenase (cytochrome c)